LPVPLRQFILIAGTVIVLMTHTVSTAAKPPALAPCPDKPNCISSQAADRDHYVEPFSFHDAPAQAMQRLRGAVLDQPRTTLVSATADYLHAEARSLIFRFVDDLEFVLAPEEHAIHVRSAARSGYSDFGVNRRRVERIRQRFLELQHGK